MIRPSLAASSISRSGRRRTILAVLVSFCQSAHVIRAYSVKSPTTERPAAASMSQQKRPTHGWCCTAILDSTAKQPRLTPLAGDVQDKGLPIYYHEDGSYDMTLSPDWMEWMEVTEGRGKDEGGAGAYDTMRCDLIVKTPQEQSEEHHHIWGKDFHMHRLQNSFSSLLDASNSGILSEGAVKMAVQESELLLQALVDEAQSSAHLKDRSHATRGEEEDEDHTWIQLLKLTLLWSLPKGNNPVDADATETSMSSIVVRGHACSSGTSLPVFRSIEPIVVTVAALGHEDDQLQETKSDDVNTDTNLPTRFQNPQSKVASWCKQRKKMDNPETYKPPGVSEVLMVRPAAEATVALLDKNGGTRYSSLELLEGLSSNVCVIYKDGTLRTPEEGILFGYVRHLVLESAARCGLKVDTSSPITMQDAIDGKWSEVFITSSSRLIWPISRILLPSSEDEHCLNEQSNEKVCEIGGFFEFWSDPGLTGPGVPVSTPQWQELLETILHSAGYTR